MMLAAVAAAPSAGRAGRRDRGAGPRVDAVHVVSRVGDPGASDDHPKRARFREPVGETDYREVPVELRRWR